MEQVEVKGFYIVGIFARTTNHNGQAMVDISGLWNKFSNQSILSKIEDRVNDDLYCVYTDYESDQNGYYTTVIGCRVESLDNIAEGLISIIVPPGKYFRYTPDDARPESVGKVWQKIWKGNLNRAYRADFDLYRAEVDDGVEVFVGVE